ncbi:oligosaccharide flippase family protein [Patescibacteria group bacterium]|nr:oligosaccharide flippase family protein [Patescibacteria group bacterium]
METLRAHAYRFLRWSEKYTKTDMVYAASGGVWLMVGQSMSSLSVFLLSLAFANLVPPETYGVYKYVLSIAALFALFTLPGMHTAIGRAVARGNTGAIPEAMRARILWSLFGMLVAFLGGAYYFIKGNNELTFAFLLIGVILPVFDTYTLYNAYLTGTRNFKTQTIVHGAVQLVSTASLVLTLFFTTNLLYILVAYFLPLAMARFIAYRFILGDIPHESPDPAVIRYGKQLSVIGILSTVASNVDKILLWKFLGPAQLAVYAFSIAIPEQLKGPLRGVGELAFPKFAAQTPEQISNSLPLLWRKLILYGVVLVTISVIYILLAPYIFAFFFPQYMESVLYSQIFATSLVAGISVIPVAALEAQKKIVAQYFLNTIQPITSIVLMLMLIPIFGVMGAISGLVIGRLMSTLYIIGTTIFIFRNRQT